MLYAAPQSFLVPREGGNATLIFFAQILVFILIFYFIFIRPGRKEQERHKQMIEGVQKGDEIVTTGGIIGTVVHAEEDRVTLKTAENTRIVVEKARIARVGRPEAESKGG